METRRETDNPLLGVSLLLGALVLMPLMDGVAKLLSTRYPVIEVVWARYFFHLAIMLPVVAWRYGLHTLALRHPGLQVLRGGFLLLATLTFFGAISLVPLADALALGFVAPLVTTALSRLVLKERIGPRRWAAVCAGFVGVVVVMRPGSGALQWGALLALGTGCAYACYSITTRYLSGSAPPLVTLTYTAMLGAVLMSAIVPAYWVTPAPGDLLLMLAMGLLAAGGHFLIIRAYEHAPASLLAPYGYVEIVTATTVGFVMFGNFPDAWTWVGVVIIVGSGVYIGVREGRARRREPAG